MLNLFKNPIRADRPLKNRGKRCQRHTGLFVPASDFCRYHAHRNEPGHNGCYCYSVFWNPVGIRNLKRGTLEPRIESGERQKFPFLNIRHKQVPAHHLCESLCVGRRSLGSKLWKLWSSSKFDTPTFGPSFLHSVFCILIFDHLPFI